MIAHLPSRQQIVLVTLLGIACAGACVLASQVDQADLHRMMRAALISESVLMLALAWFTSWRLIRR